MTHFLLLTSLIVATFVTSSLAQSSNFDRLQETYDCPKGSLWTLAEFFNQAQQELPGVVCYTVGNARTFAKALNYCHGRQAAILSPTDPYTQFTTPEGETLVNLLAGNGVSNFWYGYYSRDDTIIKDTFPMTQERDTTFQNNVFINIPWYTNLTSTPDSEPKGISDCYEMAVNLSHFCPLEEVGSGEASFLNAKRKRSIRLTDIPSLKTQSKIDFKVKDRRRRDLGAQKEAKVKVKRAVGSRDCAVQRVSVRSRNCGDSLPFVCVKPAVAKNNVILSTDSLCEPDEFGHYNIVRCFSYGQERANQATAQARCQAKGRTLYIDTDPFLRKLIVSAIINQLSDRDQPSSVYRSKLAWVGRSGQEEGKCEAMSLNTGDILAWDCSALLPFHVCQSHVNMPGVGKLSVEISVPGDAPAFNIQNIAGGDDRQASIPSEYAQPGGDFFPELSCIYESPETSLLTSSGLQTMTLLKRGVPLDQFPASSLGGEGEGPRFLNDEGTSAKLTVQLDNRQGNQRSIVDYYWCEINDLKTGNVHRSERVFVRIADEEIYAVSIAINPSFPIRPSLILQSMYGTDSVLAEATSSFFLNNFQTRTLRFRPELNSNRTIMDLHLYPFQRDGEDGEGALGVTTRDFQTTQELIRNDFSSVEGTDLDFDLNTLIVRSIETCFRTVVTDPVSGNTYSIPDTALGKVFTSPQVCLANGDPYVRLTCQGDKLYGAYWSKFKPTRGCQFNEEQTSPATNNLKNISESTINVTTLDEVLKDTTRTVESTDTLAPVDLVYLADILQRSTGVDNVSTENAQKILELVDVVAGTNQTVLEESNQLGNATNRILKAIDELGDKVIIEGDNTNARVVSDSTALEVWDLSRVSGDVIIGLELLLEGGDPVEVLARDDLVSLFDTFQPTYSDTDAAIFLPGAFVRMVQSDNPNKHIRFSMNVFAQTTLFQYGVLERGPDETMASRAVLNSKVIAAKVTIGGVAVVDLDDFNVTTVFLPVERLEDEPHEANSTCVFWDFLGSGGQGAWSAEGCRYDRTQLGRDVCVCDHLTNFAVLLDFYGQSALPKEHQLALSVITIIGLSLSIAGLACTVLSFILIKKLRQGKPQQTLFNMALAMMAAWIVFLAGFERTENKTGCLVVAALLHYFILASFMWMLMEAVLQYLLFVKVLGYTFENYLVKTAVPSWGLPLIPVVVVLALDPDLYDGGDEYCWMKLTPFYYAFLLPVALIIAVNIVVYVMVVVNICRRGNVGSSSSSGGGGKRVVGIRASVACFVVLGLSWVFAFFAVEEARVVFQYLFTISATLQGFLIFLIFTLRDPNVRAYWAQLLCRCCSQSPDKTSTSSGQPLRAKQGGGGGGGGAHGDDRRSEGMALSSSDRSGSSSANGASSNTTDTRATAASQVSSTSVSSSSGLGFDNRAYT